MNPPRIRIVTRKSPLAMWQAHHVRDRLAAHSPDLRIEIIGIRTEGDRFIDRPLSDAGGKGLFIKELEHALIANQADIAVHSMKDVTVDLPDGLAIPVVLERGDPRDAWVSNDFPQIRELPGGAIVGTSSLRRRCQLLSLRPDLVVADLRGNVGTRISKLDHGNMQGLILAAAGLQRLNEAGRISELLEPDSWLPAIGQGAIGIEVREDDTATRELLAPLDHRSTRLCVAGERAVNRRLFGGCHVPVAGFGQVEKDRLVLRALVGRPDGTGCIRDAIEGPLAEAESLGAELGARLLDRGAGAILAEIGAHG